MMHSPVPAAQQRAPRLLRRFARGVYAAVALTFAIASLSAYGFSAVVSPPRFEIKAKAGETVREVVEVSHADNAPGGYQFATADWAFAKDGTVIFTEALTANSCRTWVAIERRSASLPPNGRMKFRVEIAVPANTPPTECRFALMVQGDDQMVRSGAVPVPVAGRIGVIFYLLVGGASPALTIAPAGTQTIDGVTAALLKVSNTGNAHGRITGVLNGIDAKGQKFELLPTGLPILAGDTREVPLMPNAVGGGAANPTLPLRVTGKLEWGNTHTVLDHEFAAKSKQ